MKKNTIVIVVVLIVVAVIAVILIKQEGTQKQAQLDAETARRSRPTKKQRTSEMVKASLGTAGDIAKIFTR